MFAHVHSTAKGYFSHAGGWYELVNKESNGVVGTGTESYNLGSLSVTGNVSIAGTLTYEDVKNVDAIGLSTFREGIFLPDNKKAKFGHIVGNADLEIFSDGTNSFIDNHNGGSLILRGNNTDIQLNPVDTDFSVVAKPSSSVDLYYNNVLKFTTASSGVNVSGTTTTTGLAVTGVSTFTGIIDANGVIEGISGENKIPSLYSNMGALPNPSTYHGMFAHVHSTGRGYFSHAGGWYELVNAETNGVVGTGTQRYNLGALVSTSTTATSLNVSGITTLASAKVSDLTNGRVVTVGTGGELQDSNNLTFDGTSLFVSGINVTQPGSGTTITLGADIVTRNLKATGITTLVTTDINGDLDVDGHTNLDNVSVAGVTTFSGNARFDSTMTAGGSAGSNGQYLKTTGSGVEWATFPTLRTRSTTTASAGQTTFSFSYTVNFLDVFVNGIKLTDAEFTATNGSTVVLAVGCFVGDIVELVSYNTVSGGGGGGGGISNVVEDTTPELGGNLSLNGNSIVSTGATISSVGNAVFTGIVTGSSFVGDGSGLTGIVGSGSGVVVKNSGSTVGTAGTINFGDNLSVSAISGGSVTITGSAGVSTSQFDVNKLDVSGISTFKGNIDVNADIDVDGHTNLDNVSVAGVTTFTGAITASDIRSNALNLKNAAGSATYATFTNGGSALLKHNNTDRLETSASGVTVTGTVAATSYTGDGSQLTGIGAGSTTNVFTNSLQVTGITTFVGIATYNNRVDFRGGNYNDVWFWAHPNLPDSHMVWKSWVAGGNGGLFFSKSNIYLGAPNSQSRTHIDPHGDGSVGHLRIEQYMDYGNNPLRVHSDFVHFAGSPTASHSSRKIADFTYQDGCELYYGLPGQNDVKFATSGIGATVFGQLDTTNLNVAGISTFTGSIDANGDLDVDGHTNLDNVNIAGVVTATSFVGDGSGLTGITASGTGVVIKHDGSTVGTAGTINFSTNLDVSALSGGAVTITATAVSAGITTALTGTFTASAGSPSTINTFAYHDNDKVVEYTVYIKNGSDFQTAKVLAMRDSTTIHSTQFAVMFSSSLLAQFDTTISGGNILLRATPETGVSGSTSYRIKREVM